MVKQLADDPDDFLRQLQVLASEGVGDPTSARITVDGFQSTTVLPPKGSISSIHVNPDLFSAEYRWPPFSGGLIERSRQSQVLPRCTGQFSSLGAKGAGMQQQHSLLPRHLRASVTGVDAAGLPAAQGSLKLWIHQAAPLAFLSTSAPAGPLGYFYSAQLAATAPVSRWELKGTLPQGWTLNEGTGLLRGVASSAGSLSFTVIAHPAQGNTATIDVHIEIQQHLLEHTNRLSSRGRGKKAGNLQTTTSGTVFGFNQRIALLHSMPGLMEPLGLVLHFTFDLPSTGAPPHPIDFSNLTVQIKVNPANLPSPLPSPVCPKTTSSKDFWPMPAAASTQFAPNGWINLADGYGIGCLQMDAEATKMVQFGNRAGLRKGMAANRNAPSSTDHSLVLSYDEDVVHPLLPPSPVTSGLQVWQDNRQQRVSDRADDAQSRTVTSSSVLYADDLLSAIAVNVHRQDQDTNDWYFLTQRSELYTIDHHKLDLRQRERGVRTAATSPKSTTQGTFDADEMVFSWRLGSLVALPAMDARRSGSNKHPSQQQLPWKNFHATYTADKTPSPLFGFTYSVAMRPVFISGAVRPFDSAQAAAQTGLQLTYERYELIEGPEVIPANFGTHIFTNDETRTRLIVSSKLDESLNPKPYTRSSLRVLVPSRVSPEVARRHGKRESDIETARPCSVLRTEISPPKFRPPAAARESTFHTFPILSAPVPRSPSPT